MKKVRPDKDKIISYAFREFGLDEGHAVEALKTLVDKETVYLKSTPFCQDSYFIVKEVDVFNVRGEQLLEEKRDIAYDQSASNPDCNTSLMITDDVHTMEDNISQNELMPRDTTVFRILEKFSDILNN